MSNFPGVIKELCKSCYDKNKYHQFKIVNGNKTCENSNCNNVAYVCYVNPNDSAEFVRDLKVPDCNLEMCTKLIHPNQMSKHLRECTYAHNSYEYFVWNEMKTLKLTKIAEVFKRYFEPYVYMHVERTRTVSQNIPHYPMFKSLAIVNNKVPSSAEENEIIQKEERRRNNFCWFCMKEVMSENDISTHIDGHKHKAFYEADKKRRWYFKMPAKDDVVLCTNTDSCECSDPHSQDEYQEMIARLKFREFMSDFSADIPEKNISRWPEWMDLTIPKFPSNIKCYKTPLQLFVNLSITHPKCKELRIYLRDDESRPFFKLIKPIGVQNMNIKLKSQLLITFLDVNDLKSEIKFGIEFKPLYSSTFCQKIEFHLQDDEREFIFCKRIRADVGTDKHLSIFKETWNRYKDVISRKSKFKSFVPFDLERKSHQDILNEDLLMNVIKVIPNLTWIQTSPESYNYFGWMTDMMVLEELEQRLILSNLEYNGQMNIQNHLEINSECHYAIEGKLYGSIAFTSNHDFCAREIIVKNVSNCYIIHNDNSLNSFLFESELVDDFRYRVETRNINGVSFCLSKFTVDTLQLKQGDKINVRIYFNFNRLAFERRHKSLKNIPTYDKLSYNPLPCPFFTRLPHGDDETKIKFISQKDLNEEQKRLPRLVLRRLNSNEIPLPFVLHGAFGTGKTTVFAEAVMSILKNDSRCHILICTRSYSAVYVYLDLFEKCNTKFMPKIKPLMSDHKRDSRPVHPMPIFNANFGKQEFLTNQVFVTTLENATDCFHQYSNRTTENLVFDYIFVDEAAQVLEVDAAMVFQFGTRNTKFIFAGDIFQSRPELYNRGLKKFSIPINCRLYNTYKNQSNYIICLKQVYRTHPMIVEFLSQAIYDSSLTSLMKPSFPKFPPMKFVDSVDREKFDDQFNSFINEGECQIIMNDILSLLVNPKVNMVQNRILVCTPFYSQVKLLRENLKKVKLKNVTVELPSNIQGREFDAVFISTVLTESTNIPIFHPTFHSSKNLINLVVSRAKHFIQVVGNKSFLLSNPFTSVQWKMFMEMCEEIPNLSI